MRLTRQTRKPSRPQLNMASMIDVVFLLLIFFMCTSSFARPERSLPSRLPRVGTAGGADRQELDAVRIGLARHAAGIVLTCDDQVCATIEDLVAMLEARRALGDPPVIIQGRGDVPFGAMVAALDACHRARLYRTAFSARGTEP